MWYQCSRCSMCIWTWILNLENFKTLKNNFYKSLILPIDHDVDRFLVSDDTRTGISTILKRKQYAFNFRFKGFWWYHVILHRLNFNLKQSDKKSDQPGIQGPPRPFTFSMNFNLHTWLDQRTWWSKYPGLVRFFVRLL